MQRHARRVGTVSIGTSSPLPILSPTAQHKCKELMGVEFGYNRSLRSLKTSLRAPTSVALPKQTHAQFSPCKKIMQKWAAPSCQEQLSSHPKKEKLKIPQVSCSMARPPRSPCHRAGVTGWSPLQPECCTDSITTFGIPPLRGCCSTGSTSCPSGKQYLCQCFQLGLALLSQ